MMRHPACAAKFWIYWVFTFLTLSFFTFYGQMTVAISPNVQVSPSSPAWKAFELNFCWLHRSMALATKVCKLSSLVRAQLGRSTGTSMMLAMVPLLLSCR